MFWFELVLIVFVDVEMGRSEEGYTEVEVEV